MKVQQPIVAILLAAGAGTRFGGGKLLHPLADGTPIAAHAARNLKAAGLDVVAVVRTDDSPLMERLMQEGCRVTECADARLGMGHTLAHGIAEAREAAGWIVALGDMPRVRPETISNVVEALAHDALIAAPRYRGERGHPVGFSARLRDELLGLRGDTGARAVIERHRAEMTLLDSDDPGVLLDVDTKNDVGRL